jgi:dCMP deaminase
LVIQSGITRVVFQYGYKDPEGINFLKSAGVLVEQIETIEDGEK